MRAFIYRVFRSNHERTALINKNIFFSLVLKGGSVLMTLLMVPLTINYINPVQYGIWLTIGTIVYWFTVLDIGLGNGLKNEIAYSLALNDESKLKTYVSTTYAALSLISLLLFVVFYFVSSFFNWNKILNVPDSLGYDVRQILLIVIGFFCFEFILQLINAVLSATQQVFKSSMILFLGQLIGLITIYILTLTVPGTLRILVFALAGAPVAALLIASIFLYSKELKKFAPSFRNIDFRYSKKLLNVGGTFFLLQIGAMVLIHSNNFIISRVLGPESVTVYNIAFRLFSVLSMLFAIIIMPYWSAFTDAYAKKDFDWIKANIKKIRTIWLMLVLLGLLIFIYSARIYKIWINNSVQVPVALSLAMFIYMAAYMWHTLHTYFLNGIGKIRLQLFVLLTGLAIGIPCIFYFGKIYGLVGVVAVNSVLFAVMGGIYTIQFKKIINGTAKSIWDR
jgi:O-antigen/teichoic acid export membrane protein